MFFFLADGFELVTNLHAVGITTLFMVFCIETYFTWVFQDFVAIWEGMVDTYKTAPRAQTVDPRPAGEMTRGQNPRSRPKASYVAFASPPTVSNRGDPRQVSNYSSAQNMGTVELEPRVQAVLQSDDLYQRMDGFSAIVHSDHVQMMQTVANDQPPTANDQSQRVNFLIENPPEQLELGDCTPSVMNYLNEILKQDISLNDSIEITKSLQFMRDHWKEEEGKAQDVNFQRIVNKWANMKKRCQVSMPNLAVMDKDK